jgi:hypothetical protein
MFISPSPSFTPTFSHLYQLGSLNSSAITVFNLHDFSKTRCWCPSTFYRKKKEAIDHKTPTLSSTLIIP